MSLIGGKRKVNKSLKAWVAFVKRVQKQEKLTYKDAIHRAKVRKDKGEKWMMKGGDDDYDDKSSSSTSGSSASTSGSSASASGNDDSDSDSDSDSDNGTIKTGGRRRTRRCRGKSMKRKCRKTKRRRSRRH